MSTYVRPAVSTDSYRDADGAVIAYGSRWTEAGPPHASYSVVTHSQRFGPLHPIADALIAYLRQTYDVDVTDDLSCAQDLTHPVDAVRAVRLTPASPDAASLTFVFTDFPGVVVHAGLLHDFRYPDCGCDACDETWQTAADELEWNVQAVVSGGYREEIRGDADEPWVWYQLSATDGSQRRGGGSAAATAQLGPQLRLVADRLRTAEGWAPWPRR